MKERTKKRLRTLISPLLWVWIVIALIIALAGAILKAMAHLMVGNWKRCKEEFTYYFWP